MPPHPQHLKKTDSSCSLRAGSTRNRKACCFPAAQVTSFTHHETSTARTVESEQMHSFPGEVTPQHSALCGQGHHLCTVSPLTFELTFLSLSFLYRPTAQRGQRLARSHTGNPERHSLSISSSQVLFPDPGVTLWLGSQESVRSLDSLLGTSKHSGCPGLPGTKDFLGNESPWSELNQ